MPAFLTKISKNSPTSLGSEMNCESEHKCSINDQKNLVNKKKNTCSGSSIVL